MAIFEDLMAAIPAYTGLSPTAFFTTVVLLMTVYYLVSALFAAPKHTIVPMEPLPPPVQLGDISEEELRAYDGSDASKPLLMAIKGQIYDVSQSRMFYGPGGPYELFAGKDASRALAKMSFEEQDLTGNIEGLSVYEMSALEDWEWKFMSKYVKVGQIPGNLPKPRELPTDTNGPTAAPQENNVEAQEKENAEKMSEDVSPPAVNEETSASE